MNEPLYVHGTDNFGMNQNHKNHLLRFPTLNLLFVYFHHIISRFIFISQSCWWYSTLLLFLLLFLYFYVFKFIIFLLFSLPLPIICLNLPQPLPLPLPLPPFKCNIFLKLRWEIKTIFYIFSFSFFRFLQHFFIEIKLIVLKIFSWVRKMCWRIKNANTSPASE